MTTEEKIHEGEIIPPVSTKKKPDQRIARRQTKAIAKTGAPRGASIEQMIMKALEMDKPELIDKFVDIYERQELERKKAAFSAALAAFQLECPVIPKKQKVVETKGENRGNARYNYAAQEDVDRIIKPILGTHGLSYSISTHTEQRDKQTFLVAVCHARHSEGYEKDTPFEAPIDFGAYMTDQQKYASAGTFCERYAVKHSFGLVFAGEDDDAILAGVPTVEKINENQQADLQALIDEVKQDKSKFLRYFKVEKLADLPSASYADAVKALQKKRAA